MSEMTMTIFHRDGRSSTLGIHEATRMTRSGDGWSTQKPPPPGWERETPKYRVVRAVHPSPKPRFRFEQPFAHVADSNEWQYGERSHNAGETVETRSWPHASFKPMNYAAEKVLEFFTSRQKSRLPVAPWSVDRIRLDDGLTGSNPQPVTPRPSPVGLPVPARL